jgi:hypothetical protein
MLNNRIPAHLLISRVLFLMFFSIIGFSMPIFAQRADSSGTPGTTGTSTTPVEQNPTTTTRGAEPIIIYDNQVTPIQNNYRTATTPTVIPPTTNSSYNPFQLVKNGKSFYNEPVIEQKPKPVAEEEEAEPVHVPMANRNMQVDTANPFQLILNGNPNIFALQQGMPNQAKDKKVAKKKKKKSKNVKPLFDTTKLNYEAFVKLFGLLSIMGFLSFLTNSYKNDLKKIYKAFTNSNMMTQLYREKGSLLNIPYIPLYILFAFVGGIFIYLTTDYYKITILENKGLSLLLCIAGVGGFYLFKHLLLKLMSVIFPFDKELNQYHFLIGVFNQITGLALIPLVTVIAFAPPNIKLVAIYFAAAVIGIIMTNRFIRSIAIASKFIAFHKFHLIVYICAVEIAPIFIISKLLLE